MISKCKFGSFKKQPARLAKDEQGAETVEWVLVLGLIAVICMVAMQCVGNSLVAWWNAAVAAM